jgi:hypothetical protein
VFCSKTIKKSQKNTLTKKETSQLMVRISGYLHGLKKVRAASSWD